MPIIKKWLLRDGARLLLAVMFDDEDGKTGAQTTR